MASYNVNGLRTESKRRTIFNYLKSQKVHVVLLQETHSCSNDEKLWSNEWGNKIIYSHGTNLARGVAVLFQKHFPVEIESVRTDLKGRFIVLEVKVAALKFVLVNVYAPNEDNSDYFSNLFKVIEDRNNDSIMMAGDFNTTLDKDIDLYNNSGSNHVQKRLLLKEFMEAKGLVDVWRLHNPDSRIFTWRKPFSNDVIMSRLDYFLISQDIFLRVHKSEINMKFMSDHSRVTLSLDCSETKRGKGYWKFNNLLLKDKIFINEMKESILSFRFAVKNRDEIHPFIQWETLKTLVKEYTQKYSSAKARQKNLLIENFERRLLVLDKKLLEAETPELKVKYLTDIRKTQDFLLDEYELRVQAACFRSKAEYFLYGEKNSQYFFNLEKVRGNAKIISRLICDNGSIIDDPEQILREQKRFYEELYSLKEVGDWPYFNDSDVKLDQIDKEFMEMDYSDGELSNALMGMENSKTPGLDGLSADFYKCFWDYLKYLFGLVVRMALSEGLLHESARQGIISLLLKKFKDCNYLKNWRPLTLLNVDYKILSRAVALRLKDKTGHLIHEDQTGFLAGRDITHSLRTILDVIQVANRNSLDLILVSMDWQKCFDRISFTALDSALDYFNFGPKFRHTIQVLLRNSQCQVLNNGFMSQPFPVLSGVRQGANASPNLFILLAEVLSIQIRKNTNIKGVTLGDTERKLTQFADDMTLFLKFEKHTILTFEDTLTAFEEATSLKVNYDKTALYRVGSLANTCARIFTRKPFLWTNGPIKVLGIDIMNDTQSMHRCNLQDLLKSMQRRCELWKYRGISLMGKIVVVNSLCASLFVYRLSVLGFMSKDQIRYFNDNIRQFLWNGSRPKIALEKLHNPKEYGGLKLVDIRAKDRALKCQWVSVIRQNSSIANLAYLFLPAIGEGIWLCNLKKSDILVTVVDCFWRDVLIAWMEVYSVVPDNPTKIATQSIWFNSYIKVRNKVIFYPTAHEAGIRFLYNLWNESQQQFFTYPQLIQIYGVNSLTFLEYYGILSAIPRSWVAQLKETTQLVNTFIYPFENFDGKTTADTYNKIVACKNRLNPVKIKWQDKLSTPLFYDIYLDAFVQLYKLTPSTKIRDFQFRLLHRVIFTNHTLYRWGIVESPRCDFCEIESETIEHLFLTCTVTKRFWEMFQAWYECLTDTEIELPHDVIILCNSDSDFLNVLLIIAKQYIFNRKCLGKELNVYTFKERVADIIRIERFYAFRTKKFKNFVKKWHLYFAL